MTDKSHTPHTSGICPQCGKPFSRPPNVSASKRFCSAKCRQDYHLAERKEALRKYKAERELGEQAE